MLKAMMCEIQIRAAQDDQERILAAKGSGREGSNSGEARALGMGPPAEDTPAEPSGAFTPVSRSTTLPFPALLTHQPQRGREQSNHCIINRIKFITRSINLIN